MEHDNIELYSEGEYAADALYDPASGGFRIIIWSRRLRRAVQKHDALYYSVREAEAFARKQIKTLLQQGDEDR